MAKKTIIIVVVILVLIILVAGGYIFWDQYKKFKEKNPFGDLADFAKNIGNVATRGVLPSLETNPFADKPNLNPVDKTNPYANIKTNPF